MATLIKSDNFGGSDFNFKYWVIKFSDSVAPYSRTGEYYKWFSLMTSASLEKIVVLTYNADDIAVRSGSYSKSSSTCVIGGITMKKYILTPSSTVGSYMSIEIKRNTSTPDAAKFKDTVVYIEKNTYYLLNPNAQSSDKKDIVFNLDTAPYLMYDNPRTSISFNYGYTSAYGNTHALLDIMDKVYDMNLAYPVSGSGVNCNMMDFLHMGESIPTTATSRYHTVTYNNTTENEVLGLEINLAGLTATGNVSDLIKGMAGSGRRKVIIEFTNVPGGPYTNFYAYINGSGNVYMDKKSQFIVT